MPRLLVAENLPLALQMVSRATFAYTNESGLAAAIAHRKGGAEKF